MLAQKSFFGNYGKNVYFFKKYSAAQWSTNIAQFSTTFFFFLNSSWRCQLHAHAIIITDSNGDTSVGYDEIKHYEENHYIGPVEAYFVEFLVNLYLKSQSFFRLPVHLPNEQNVIIRERNGETDMFFNLEKKNKLLDYFDLNKRDSQARHYYYYEIPEHYTWKAKSV